MACSKSCLSLGRCSADTSSRRRFVRLWMNTSVAVAIVQDSCGFCWFSSCGIVIFSKQEGRKNAMVWNRSLSRTFWTRVENRRDGWGEESETMPLTDGQPDNGVPGYPPKVFLMANTLETGGSERQFAALAQGLSPSTLCIQLGCLHKTGVFA